MDRVALIREHVPGLRAHHRHHRRLPGGDRGGLPRDARGRRGGRLRRRLHVHLLAAPRHRGGRRFTDDFVPHEVAGRAHGAARRGRPAPRPRARPALRRPHARGARRGHLAHRRRAASAAARATTRSSTSPASPRRARSSPVEITEATSQTLMRRAGRACSRPRRLTALPSVRACANIRSCAGTDRRSKPTSRRRLPGFSRGRVVRRFDAPEALDTRFHEVRAKSALNRVPAVRGSRSSGR